MALPLMHASLGWLALARPALDPLLGRCSIVTSSFALAPPERRRGVARAGWHPEAPADILAERFARGEIDAAEYRARLNVLGQ